MRKVIFSKGKKIKVMGCNLLCWITIQHAVLAKTGKTRDLSCF